MIDTALAMRHLAFVRSRQWRSLALAVIAPAILSSGCGGATKPEETATGQYTLSSINGQPLPYIVVHGITKYEFLSASLTFLTRGRIADVRAYRLTTGFAESISYDTLSSTPSYALRSGQLVVSHNTGANAWADSGTMSASAITLQTSHYDPITSDSFTLTYSRASGK